MHDLLAAKEILDTALATAKEKGVKKITKIVIELGNKEYSHGSIPNHSGLTIGGGHEHLETIEPENLEFNLKLVAKNTIAENAKFVIKKPARFALRSKAGGSDKPDILVKEIEGE